MKKLGFLIFAGMLLFTACEKKADGMEGEFQDGTYFGTYQHFDNHGWKAQLEIGVEDGAIVSARWDYINPQGELKSLNEGYAEMMESRSGTTPAIAGEELQNMLVERQSAEVDDVTGATHSSEKFRELARAVLAQAKEGDTSTVELPTNGTYRASEAEPDERGWTAELSITFEDNRIVSADYNEYDQDGAPKSFNTEYAEHMASVSGVTPAEAKEQLEAQLIEEQSADIDGVAGATSSSNRFIALVENILSQR